jgi:hypothetical protein
VSPNCPVPSRLIKELSRQWRSQGQVKTVSFSGLGTAMLIRPLSNLHQGLLHSATTLGSKGMITHFKPALKYKSFACSRK